MGQPAARLTDMHVCPMSTGPVPHVGGPIAGPGCPTVLIGGLPAARVSDMATCVGPPDTIVKGSTGVFIGGLPAARMGDSCAHGGTIVVGCPTVLIGDTWGGGGGTAGGGSGAGSSGAESVQANVAGKSAAAAGWDVPSVLKILCAKDGNVVSGLNKLNVTKYDSITFRDHKFDGTKWVEDPFEAGGTAQGNNVTILSGTSAKRAAVTLYHEWWHTTQPVGMNHCDREREAYEKTEQWAIDRDLPGQGDMRKFVDGKWVPDKAAIEKVVRTYPGCGSGTTASDPYEVGYDPDKNLTKIYDPKTNTYSWRPSKEGDKVEGQDPVMIPPEPIVISKSSWKCP